MGIISNGNTVIDNGAIDANEVDTTQIANGAVTGVKLSGLTNFKNIIINGDMSIAQRGTSETGLGNGDNGYYTCDRYRFTEAGAPTFEFTMSQDTDVPTGQGFATSLKMDCTTAQGSLASADALRIEQRFEGQNLQYLKKGTSSAESLTLSFWVKSNKTGTYIAELFDVDNTRSISKSYTIDSASTWEKKTITYAGDTTGAFDNDNDISLALRLWLGAGSNFTSGTLNTSWNSVTNANRAVGQVNLADNTANEWYITGVQLEAGTAASDFEFLPQAINEDLCRRYFQKSYVRGVFAGASTNLGMVTTARLNNTVANRPTNVFFRPIMRATPTFTLYSIDGTSGNVSDLGTSTFHTRNEPASASVLSEMGMGYLTGVGGLSANDGVGFHYTADAELS